MDVFQVFDRFELHDNCIVQEQASSLFSRRCRSRGDRLKNSRQFNGENSSEFAGMPGTGAIAPIEQESGESSKESKKTPRPLSGGLLADFHSQEEQRPLLRTASPGTDAAPPRHAVIAS